MDHVTQDCETTIDGEQLRVRLRLTLTSLGSNDVRRVQVRASDNGESRIFRDTDVNVHQIRVKVVKTDHKVAVNRTASASPFTITVKPSTSAIRNVLSVTVKLRWKIDGHTTAPFSCDILRV